eukprot:gene4932-6015_t
MLEKARIKRSRFEAHPRIHFGGTTFSARVLESFKRGEINTIVATSVSTSTDPVVGEEGLDIAQVDLIVIFDAMASPTRMVQRMGRTGRARNGRVVVLAMAGKELQDYEKNLEKTRGIHRALRTGGFPLHPSRSPRMVPRRYTPVVELRTIVVTPRPAARPSKRGLHGAAVGSAWDDPLTVDEEELLARCDPLAIDEDRLLVKHSERACAFIHTMHLLAGDESADGAGVGEGAGADDDSDTDDLFAGARTLGMPTLQFSPRLDRAPRRTSQWHLTAEAPREAPDCPEQVEAAGDDHVPLSAEAGFDEERALVSSFWRVAQVDAGPCCSVQGAGAINDGLPVDDSPMAAPPPEAAEPFVWSPAALSDAKHTCAIPTDDGGAGGRSDICPLPAEASDPVALRHDGARGDAPPPGPSKMGSAGPCEAASGTPHALEGRASIQLAPPVSMAADEVATGTSAGPGSAADLGQASALGAIRRDSHGVDCGAWRGEERVLEEPHAAAGLGAREPGAGDLSSYDVVDLVEAEAVADDWWSSPVHDAGGSSLTRATAARALTAVETRAWRERAPSTCAGAPEPRRLRGKLSTPKALLEASGMAKTSAAEALLASWTAKISIAEASEAYRTAQDAMTGWWEGMGHSARLS